MAELGSFYMGNDDVMALRWLRPAAAQGHGGAQGNLGYMYQHGHGVPRDDAEAARLYRLAAEQGVAQAQHNLGVMYLHGQGVPKDTAEAARWFRLAADQGHPDAVAALGRTEPTHTLPSPPGAEERVDAEEQYRLGQRYQYEVEDYAEAARWYRLAAEQGHVEAQYSLGLVYATGRGVEQDYAEAARWYRLAAEQGHPSSQFLLADLYEQGGGVERDFSEAVRWYRLAAENGDDKAAEQIESLETWRCFDATDFNRTNGLLTLSRLENGGEVSIAGTTHPAAFEVEGLNRRWDFGLDDDGTFDYMFLIEPGGRYTGPRTLDGPLAMTDDELREHFARIAAAQDRTDAQLKALAASQDRTDAQLAENAAQMAKTDAKLRELAERYGGLGNSVGEVAEEFFFNSLEADPGTGRRSLRLRRQERDAQPRPGCRTSSTCCWSTAARCWSWRSSTRRHENDLRRLVDKKAANFRRLFPEYADHEQGLALAAFRVRDKLKSEALERGVTVLQRKGDVIETIAA